LLKIGDTVNVTLLHPILTYTYSVYQIEEVETPYEKKTITDATKAYGYSEITQSGLTGISINKETYDVVNGEASSEIKFVGTPEVIREAVTQITTVGPKYSNSVTGSYVYTDGDWGRPVNTPYRITSKYGYRWGKVHEGVDISGTGDGSPIYAIGDGEVVQVVSACSSCLRWANGNYVVIKHANGYYSAYLHLKGFNVKVGDVVTKGQVIAYMGSTGYATGVHLHLGFFKGEPYVGGTYQSFDPLKTCMKGIL
jgi:murein DD-endopeptidase MepM/ murein hydrolase activator NlpD